MASTRTTRVVAIGYQGFGNLGDDAILGGIERLLAGTPIHVDCIVGGPLVASIPAFPEARRIRSPRLLPTLGALRALRSADCLMLSGGGLLHDHWPTVIPRYLSWMLLARAVGARVLWLGVGVGPVRRRLHRLLVRLALGLTRAAFVRDAASARLLGGPNAHVRIIPDPSLFNDPPTRAPEPRRLGIIIRGPLPSEREMASERASGVVALAAAARARGWHPWVATMAGASDAEFSDLVTASAHSCGEPLGIEALGPTPADAMVQLGRCEAVISVRLHGLLLAALVGTPCVALAYDPKVRHAAAALGIPVLGVDHGARDPERSLDLVDEALTAELRATVAGSVGAARARCEPLRGLLARALCEHRS